MIEKVLQDLVKSQNYCVVETSEAIFEGFVTKVEDEAVEMYAFYPADDENQVYDEENTSNTIISRVVFMISNIEYVYPDHYIKVPVTDLQVKTLMKENLVKERSVTTTSRKKVPKEKKSTTKNK